MSESPASEHDASESTAPEVAPRLRKTLLVARRELLENLRTKAFWIGLFTFPVIIGLSLVVPLVLQQVKDARTYVVIDRSGWLLDAASERLDAEGGRQFRRVEPASLGLPEEAGDHSTDEAIAELRRLVAEGELFAYAVLGEDPVGAPGPAAEPAESSGFRYVSANLTDDGLRLWLTDVVSDVVRTRRLEQAALDAELVDWVAARTTFEVVAVDADGEEAAADAEDMVRQWAPVGFVYMLWIAIFGIAQMLLTNTIEEKSNRLMEVLLSSVSPLQLMAGKILGIAATGLIMIGAWGAFAAIAMLLPIAFGLDLPLDLGTVFGDPVYVASFVVYFVLGYLFYAGLLVGIGAVCNSLKEAQNLQTPILIVLMMPLFAMIPVAQDPNGLLAKVLSYVPPFTPFVMMNRAAGPPTPLEYLLTTLLLAVSVGLVLWGAAKIFRVGVLMTGKPPRLGEILRWLRAPVGSVPARK